MRLLTLGIAILLSGQVSAEIFRTYDKNGNPAFSDSASGESESVQTRETMVVPALSPDVIQKKLRPEATAKAADTEPKTYKIGISRPLADETLAHGIVAFAVAFQLEPKLWHDHHFEVLVDGVRLAKDSYSPKLDPAKLDRGQHRLEIKVMDAKGKVVASQGQDFHVQHVSVLNRPPAKSK